MRIARFGILGALALSAIGCQTDDGGATSPTIPPLAFVRYINAVPDTNNLTVRFIDQVSFTPQTFIDVPYRGLGQGGYQGLRAGTRRLRVFTHDPALNGGSQTPGAVTVQIADTSFDFVAGQYYTLLHYGYARAGQIPQQRVLILNDVLPAVSTQLQVRGLNAQVGLGAVTAVDYLVTGAPIITNVAQGASSAFITRAPQATAADTLRVSFSQTGSTVAIATGNAPVGVAGTPTADPLAGGNVGGSVLTAVAFGPSVAGSRAAAAANPSVVFFQDRQPPRTTP